VIANRYVALMDILGFSQRIRTRGTQECAAILHYLSEDCSAMEEQVSFKVLESGFSEHKFHFSRLHFSDTVAIWSEPVSESAEDREAVLIPFLFELCSLIYRGIRNGIPLRVGVAFGQLYADIRESILVGPALVEAYEIEESQEWIGCGAGRSCCAQALEPLVEYEVPVKAGKEPVPYALDWTIAGRI
jgi:hypothetical protein